MIGTRSPRPSRSPRPRPDRRAGDRRPRRAAWRSSRRGRRSSIAVLEQATEIPDASAVYLVAVVVVGWIGGTGPGARHGRRRVPRLRPPVHRAALVARGRRPERAAQPRARPDRRARRRAARRARSRACRRGGPARARGDRPVRRQPAARDRRHDRGGRRRDRRAARPRRRPGARLDRARTRAAATQILADTGAGPTACRRRSSRRCVRTPGDEPARWVRAHEPIARRRGRRSASRPRATSSGSGSRPAGTDFGSLWAVNARRAPRHSGRRRRGSSLSRPTRSRSGCVATGCARRRPAPRSPGGATPSRARCSTRSRTTCGRRWRASAPRPATWPTRRSAGRRPRLRRAAEAIDAEAQRLDRFVRSVLDLSRIESGALRPDLEVYEVRAAHRAGRRQARDRSSATGRSRSIVADGPPLVRVDAVLFDAIVSNILDNVADHTPPRTPVRHRGAPGGPGRVVIRSRTAARASRQPTSRRSSTSSSAAAGTRERARRGMGVGLSIVRGHDRGDRRRRRRLVRASWAAWPSTSTSRPCPAPAEPDPR